MVKGEIWFENLVCFVLVEVWLLEFVGIDFCVYEVIKKSVDKVLNGVLKMFFFFE